MHACQPDSPVRVAREGAVLTITLHREAAANALDAPLVEALLAALAPEALAGQRLVVLRGAGKGFCGGFDLGGLETQSDGDLLHRFVRIEMLLQRLRHAPLPTLALAHGFAFGAGADIFAACTWRIAAPGTRFAFPGARFGIVLGTRRLASLIGPQATLDLTLRGQRIDADRALAIGLATRVAAAEAWPDAIAGLDAELASVAEDARPMLHRAALPDATRDADLADLVRSAASPGSGQGYGPTRTPIARPARIEVETAVFDGESSRTLKRLEANAGEAARMLRLLANEKRLLMLCHLVGAGEMNVGTLAEAVGLSQSALSQHLAKLREDGLVATRRDAQTIYYRLADPKAAQVLILLRDLYCPTEG